MIAFFALLSGLFHPLITGASIDTVIVGVMILFVGLAGGVLIYKGTTSDSKRAMFLGGGFGLIALSLAFVSQMSGRF